MQTGGSSTCQALFSTIQAGTAGTLLRVSGRAESSHRSVQARLGHMRILQPKQFVGSRVQISILWQPG